MNAHKAKGTAWESRVRDYLNEHLADLGIQVERPAQQGFKDIGDLIGVPYFALQLKDYADTMRAIREGLEGVQVQKENAGKPLGAVVVKRRRRPPGTAYVAMTLDDLIAIIRALTLGVPDALRYRS